jgi:Tfp pilus assembly protein PilF/2-polyprenyl-3-methyl-5-hydroxy-6-metoxy-1,4-benzoquinol methylase
MKGRTIPRAGAGRQHTRHNADTLITKALAQQQKGDLSAAIQICQRAIKFFSADPRPHLLLARLQQQQGQTADSMRTYQRCLQQQPDNIEALINLGMLHKASGDAAAAIEVYKRAIRLAPAIPEVHNNLGNALRDQGRYADAASAFARAIEIKPDFAGAWHNLGRLQLESNNPATALPSLRRACSLPGSNQNMRDDLADCLGLLPMSHVDAEIESDLMRCLELQRVDGRLLSQASARYLCAQIFSDYLHADRPTAIDITDSRLSHPLLITLLQREPLCDRALESLLIRVRRQCLLTRRANAIATDWLPALAYQCYLNEYVWNETAEETAVLNELEHTLRAGLQSVDTLNEPALMLYASYRPLAQLGIQPALARTIGTQASSTFTRLLRQQVLEPALEAEFRQTMPCLTPVADETSTAVRSQYEHNPYPRWQMIDQPMAGSLTSYLDGLFPQWRNTMPGLAESPDILIAGCGTGLQAIRMARRIPAATITAIDLSLASLAYGKRRALELELSDRIRFAQADILQLKPSTGRFDCIECFGVLHHMADPEAGWYCLRALLKPGGVMRIGLYSEHARKPIRAARELIEQHALPATKEGIRTCRELIAALPAEHPASVLVHSPDFYSTSECRDLLFHVQEQQLNLQSIAAMLNRLELRFLGFEFNSLAGCAVIGSGFPTTQRRRICRTGIDWNRNSLIPLPRNTFSGSRQHNECHREFSRAAGIGP